MAAQRRRVVIHPSVAARLCQLDHPLSPAAWDFYGVVFEASLTQPIALIAVEGFLDAMGAILDKDMAGPAAIAVRPALVVKIAVTFHSITMREPDEEPSTNRFLVLVRRRQLEEAASTTVTRLNERHHIEIDDDVMYALIAHARRLPLLVADEELFATYTAMKAALGSYANLHVVLITDFRTILGG